MSSSTRALADAFAACERIARHHYENFPVASRLLPAPMRPHVAAVYAFARVADDIADEPGLSRHERQRRLDDWLMRLRACARGMIHTEAADDPHARIFLALSHSIRARGLPVALFEDLLSAFRQDTETTRYETWKDVFDYCRRSANPVGRLVLRIGGYHDAQLEASSDGLCTALQLTNFWQDLAIDWSRGRLYLPREEWRPVGAAEQDLDRRELTPAWRAALAAAVGKTRAWFERGRAVCDGVRGRLRVELRLTWLGGTRILDCLEATGFDVFRARPALGVSDLVPIVWRALTWSRRPS